MPFKNKQGWAGYPAGKTARHGLVKNRNFSSVLENYVQTL